MRYSFVALALALAALLAAAAPSQQPADPVAEIASAIRNREFPRALELARSALERSPNDVRLLTMEGITLAALGRHREALAGYRRALTLAPDYLGALEGAAQLEYQAGADGAIPLLERILKLAPQNATAHAMRAVMAAKKRDCETAAQHFAAASSAISSQPNALRQYAACLMRLDRAAEALPVLRQLSALDPADRHARYRLAAAEFMAKTYADSLATLGPLIERKDPEALDLASQAWEAQGDTPRATAALREAIVLSPSDPRLYVDFASLCLVHKSYEAGLAMTNAGLARLPRSAELYIARGVLNVQLARYDEADADFAAAERLDPRQAYGSVARGLAQVQQDDFDKALATVRDQLKSRGNDEFLYYLLAEILSSQGATPGSAEFKEAVGAASRAVALKPDLYLARDVLSRLYLQAGQIDQAIEQCHLALRSNPLDATALYRLIRALQKSGRPGADAEIKDLLKRFNEVREKLRIQEAEETRYRLVEGPSGQK
jgi:tetratricopeptide (TPR) repeat protein